MKEDNTRCLEKASKAMIRWICGVFFKNRVSSRVDLKSIDDLMRDKRSRWFGHVERSGEDP